MVDLILNNLTTLFLMGLLVFTEIRNYIERKNLMDRLMARDLNEVVLAENERKRARVTDDVDRSGGIPI